MIKNLFYQHTDVFMIHDSCGRTAALSSTNGGEVQL